MWYTTVCSSMCHENILDSSFIFSELVVFASFVFHNRCFICIPNHNIALAACLAFFTQHLAYTGIYLLPIISAREESNTSAPPLKDMSKQWHSFSSDRDSGNVSAKSFQDSSNGKTTESPCLLYPKLL